MHHHVQTHQRERACHPACFATYFVRTQCTSSLWSFTPYGVHVTSVTLSAPCSITRDPTSSGHTTSESTIL